MKKTSHRAKQARLSQILFGLSLICLIFGLINLAWAMWPTGTDAIQLDIPAGQLPGAPAGHDYAAIDDYLLAITWPRWVRLGRKGQITLTMTPNLPTDEAADERQSAAIQTVMFEPVLARLPLDPPGLVQSTVAEGQSLSMSWTFSPVQRGQYPGKIYISFGFYDSSTEELIAVPVAVVDVSIQVTALWGLEANLVLWLGIVGLVLWGGLFIAGRMIETKK